MSKIINYWYCQSVPDKRGNCTTARNFRCNHSADQPPSGGRTHQSVRRRLLALAFGRKASVYRVAHAPVNSGWAGCMADLFRSFFRWRRQNAPFKLSLAHPCCFKLARTTFNQVVFNVLRLQYSGQ
jgi:hypothetical protein